MAYLDWKLLSRLKLGTLNVAIWKIDFSLLALLIVDTIIIDITIIIDDEPITLIGRERTELGG